MLAKPCRICGVPTKNVLARCDAHKLPSAHQRGYGSDYRRNRDIVVKQWRILGLPCWICGHRINPKERITAEHVIPRSKGGTGVLGNLRGAHERCNKGHGGNPAGRHANPR